MIDIDSYDDGDDGGYGGVGCVGSVKTFVDDKAYVLLQVSSGLTCHWQEKVSFNSNSV